MTDERALEIAIAELHNKRREAANLGLWLYEKDLSQSVFALEGLRIHLNPKLDTAVESDTL